MAINYGSNTVTSSTFQGTDKIINGTVETLYFYGNSDWGQSYAWYKDSNHTISANRLPNETDNVILLGDVSSNTSNAAKCANLVVGGHNISTTICVGSTITRQGSLSQNNLIYIANTTGLFEGMRVEGIGIPINTVIMSVSSSSISISTNASINASSSLTFYGQAYFSGGSFGNTLNGDAYFSSSTNNGTINGDAYFSGSTNNGTINGDAVLSGTSSIYGGSSSSPIVTGSLALNDTSYTSGTTYVGGNVTLNNHSYLSSYVLYANGNIIVNDASYLGSAYAAGNIVLNDISYLVGSSYTTRDIIFNDSSYANSSITSSGDVTFNGNSHASGSITSSGDVAFNDNSYASYSITSSGDITFNGSSYINSSVPMTCANLIWNTLYNTYGNYTTSSPIVGNAIFLTGSLGYGGSSLASPAITGSLTLKNGSYVNTTAYVAGDIVLYAGYLSTTYAGGDVTFNGGSYASSPITSSGDVAFNDNSYASSSITSSGDITFNDSSYISSSVTMTCANLIWNTSYNSGNYNTSSPIVGNAIFLTGYLGYGGISLISPVVTGSLTLKNGSYVNTTAYVAGDIFLYDNSYLSTVVYPGGDVTFNNNSSNNGTLSSIKNVTFNDTSYMYNGSSFSFSNKSQLILNTTTSNVPNSVSITDGNNLLTIVVNKLPNNSNGWIFGNGGNSIQCNTLIFNEECYLKGANTYNISNLIFNDKSYIQDYTTNSSSVVVATRATFNNESYCGGYLDVDLAIFNDNSYIDTDGVISGSYGTNNAIFNTNSHNNGTVDNDAIFNDYSVNDGQVENNAVFNGFSNNIGTIGNDAFFNDLSTNSTGGNVSYVGYYYGLNNSNGGSDDTAYYLINE